MCEGIVLKWHLWASTNFGGICKNFDGNRGHKKDTNPNNALFTLFDSPQMTIWVASKWMVIQMHGKSIKMDGQ